MRTGHILKSTTRTAPGAAHRCGLPASRSTMQTTTGACSSAKRAARARSKSSKSDRFSDRPQRPRMSALGQKQTYAVQKGMSALPARSGQVGFKFYLEMEVAVAVAVTMFSADGFAKLL